MKHINGVLTIEAEEKTAIESAAPAIAASQITSGTINHARLGSGGGGSTKFLREDNTFQTIAGGGDLVSTNNLSDVANAATAFGNIKQAASTTVTGVVLAPMVFTLAGDVATAADTNPVSLTGLVFSYAANSTYRIWFMGRVAPTANTTGCGFQFDLSSTVTAIDVAFYHQLANTGTLSGGHSIADDASVGVSSGMPGTSTYPIVGTGLLRTNGNTDTAQLRFRAEVAAVTTAKAGLTLIVEKVA